MDPQQITPPSSNQSQHEMTQVGQESTPVEPSVQKPTTLHIILTVGFLLLTFFIPLAGLLGVCFMWMWMKWPKWVKVIITLPIILVEIFIGLATVFFIVYIFLFRPFTVTGEAMLPTYPSGAYVLASIPAKSSVTRSDIIIAMSPVDENKDIIKRIIGIPGDKIQLEEGFVYLNGEKLEETYLENQQSTFGGAFLQDGEEVTVPPDSYFVLGDNRPYSADSREWGFLKRDSVIGKVTSCYSGCK